MKLTKTLTVKDEEPIDIDTLIEFLKIEKNNGATNVEIYIDTFDGCTDGIDIDCYKP